MKLKMKTLAAIALLFHFGSPAGFAALPVGPDESSMTDVAEAETSSGIMDGKHGGGSPFDREFAQASVL